MIQLLIAIIIPTNIWANEIVIAIAEWPPYEFIDETGKPSGINVTTINESTKQLGIKIKFVQYPWSRALLYAKRGKVDGIMSLYKNTERENFFHFVPECISRDDNVLITFHKTQYTFSGNLQDLSGETVIVAKNNSYGEAFDKADYFEKYDVGSNMQILDMVAINRYPLGISSRLPLIHLARKKGIANKLKILEPPVSSDCLYMAFTKAKGDKFLALSNQIASAVKEYKNGNDYKKMIKSYKLAPDAKK